jgi:signal transduction histidine kinase
MTNRSESRGSADGTDEIKAVRRRTRVTRAALERRIADLTEAVRARDEFVATAAHELRNPMTPILMRVEQMLELARRPDVACPERIVAGLASLQDHLDRYIQRAILLLDVTRIVSGQLHLRLESTDLSALLRATVQRHEPLAAKAGSTWCSRSRTG